LIDKLIKKHQFITIQVWPHLKKPLTNSNSFESLLGLEDNEEEMHDIGIS
jgi:hypothetical protein